MSGTDLHEQTGAALVAAVDKRLIGFAEIAYAAKLASQVRSGRVLTTNDARQAWRMLNRIRDKLAGHGIELPGAATPKVEITATVAAPRVTQIAMRRDGRIGVTDAPMELNPVFKNALHSHWDRHKEQWPFPATPAYAGALLEALGAHPYVASERVLALAREYTSLPTSRALLDPNSPVPNFDYSRLVVPGASVWEHQARGIEFALAQSATLLAMPMGPQPVDTPILTPQGWRELGDLVAGDEVYGADGCPVSIRDVRHYGQQPVYRVTLSDGTSTRCTTEHRWRVQSASQRHEGRGGGRVVTTAQMLAEGLRSEGSRNAARFFLPSQPEVMGGPVEADQLPIPPYALGVLLGDGSLRTSVTVTCPDEEVLRRLVAETGKAFGTQWAWSNPSARCSYVRARKSDLDDVLESLGLRVNSALKTIPPTYLLADTESRRDLLAGLMDTDGSGSGNYRAEFSSASPHLAHAVATLARSLGGVVRESAARSTAYTRPDGTRVPCLDSYRVTMAFSTMSVSPFRLRRKHEDYARSRRSGGLPPQRSVPPRAVRAIDSDGVADVCCIELDVNDPDQAVYLTDTTLIPTLNSGKTATTVWAINRERARRVLILCPNKVRGVWPREIAKWSRLPWHVVDGKRPAKVKGGRPQDLKVTERLHQAESCLFDCPCDAVTHCVVMNYEMLAQEQISNWIPNLPLDVVVYDEIHRLKSPTGVMSKTAARWVNFSNRRIGLTGTPMPQHPWDIFGVLRALDPGIFGPVWTPFKNTYVETKVRKEDGKEFPVSIRREVRPEFVDKVQRIMYRPTVDLKLPPITHSVREVELEPKARREYERLDKEQFADLTEFVKLDSEDEAEDMLSPKNVLARNMRLMQFTGGTIPNDGEKDDTGKLVRTLYRVSRAKADELAEFTGNTITGGVLDEIGCTHIGAEPVVVYCQFRPDLDAVREVAEKAGLRYAEISGRRSDGLTDSSEMNPDCEILGVQIQSGGTGVDLTRSRYSVWYSVGHSLGDFDQARKRQDRPGQTRPVLNIYLVATGTVDEQVYSALATRRSIVGSMLMARGISPAVAGLDPDDGAMIDTAEMERLFNADTGDDPSRGLAGVVLPIDEFNSDVMGDPRGYGPRRTLEVPDEATLREFDLEGFFD